MHMYPIDGAAQDPDSSDTAWSYRDANWGSVFAGVDPDPANVDAIRKWTVDYQEALHPYSAGGAYVNMMMDEGQERVRASYRDNYDRLAQIKREYDPDNLFRVNQNIEPQTRAAAGRIWRSFTTGDCGPRRRPRMPHARLDAPGQHQCPRAEQHQAAGGPGTDHRVAPIEAESAGPAWGPVSRRNGTASDPSRRRTGSSLAPTTGSNGTALSRRGGAGSGRERPSRLSRRPDLARAEIVLCAAAGTTGAMTAPIRIATVIVVIVDVRIPYSFPMTA